MERNHTATSKNEIVLFYSQRAATLHGHCRAIVHDEGQINPRTVIFTALYTVKDKEKYNQPDKKIIWQGEESLFSFQGSVKGSTLGRERNRTPRPPGF